jgi:hypothetical protein
MISFERETYSMNYLIKSSQGQPIQMAINTCIARRNRLRLSLHVNGSEDSDEYRIIIRQAMSTGEPFDLILYAENNPEASSKSAEIAHYLGYSLDSRHAFGVEIPENCNIIVIADANFHSDILNDGTVRSHSFLIDLADEPSDIDRLIHLIDSGLNNSHLNYPNSRNLIVCAYQLCGNDDLCDEDLSVHGGYQCSVHGPIAEDVACELALESFHSSIPISDLGSFDIRVFDLTSKTELVGSPSPMNNFHVIEIDADKCPIPDWADKLYGQDDEIIAGYSDSPSP